jgi:hypothetical protein
MIINPYLVLPSTSYDADAQAFFNAETAAGVTLTSTEMTAINTLVVNLKAANIWSKMKALYPFVGSTSTSQKFNLKDPRDLNAAYRLAFTGGWTHSSTGALPNGTNAYADTFLATNALSLNSVHLSFYSRTNNTTVSVDMGGGNSTPDSYTIMQLRSYHSPTNTAIWINNTSTYNSVTGVNTAAFFVGSRTASNVIKLFRNGSAIINGTAPSSATSTRSQWIGAFNFVGAPYYSNRECAFASIGDGLTDLESQVFNQIVEGYQFTLGRNMSPAQSFYYNTAYNNETNAYLYSTQITDTTTQVATNTLVNDLKAAGVWTKMKAVYPMAGSTATTQKYNLVNSQDTNAAFRLSFVGGWTHSSLGAFGNGTNTYMDTFVLGGTNITGSNYGYGVYINTEADQNVQDIGVGANSHLIANFGGLTYFRGLELYIDGQYLNNSSRGFFHQYGKAGSGESSTGFVNGTKRATLNGPGYLDAANVYIGGRTIYSSKRYAFGFISDKLTDTEATNLYTAVQNFQISLGRAIYLSPPTVSDSDAQAFINAANIIDQAEATAVNNLTIGLKADNLWTKMKAIYPFVGGVASSQKYNLVNPLDTNAAFRLTFNGGWTHSFNGALPNGTNTYANTFFNASTEWSSLNNVGFSIYNRTSNTYTGSPNHGIIPTSQLTRIYYSPRVSPSFFHCGTESGATYRVNSVTPTRLGFHTNIRNANNFRQCFVNGVSSGTNTNNDTTGALPNFTFYLAASNNNNTAVNFTNDQITFSAFHDSITSTEAANFYNRVQTFNTTLQRQV